MSASSLIEKSPEQSRRCHGVPARPYSSNEPKEAPEADPAADSESQGGHVEEARHSRGYYAYHHGRRPCPPNHPYKIMVEAELRESVVESGKGRPKCNSFGRA